MNRYRWTLVVAALAVGAVVGAVAIFHPAPAASPSAAPPTLGPEADRPPAPEFTGIEGWLNSKPLSLSTLRGRVVVIDFWTFSCVNCVRTLPALEALDTRYRSRGLVIVGVHSPEFDFEKDSGNVAAAVTRLGVRYPVALDPQMATWSAWQNNYWPAQYVVDPQGRVAWAHAGEGGDAALETTVRDLVGIRAGTPAPLPEHLPTADTTPEIYAGSDAASQHRGHLGDGETWGAHGATVVYPASAAPAREPDAFEVSGSFRDLGDRLEAVSAGHVRLRFHANDVDIVAGSRDGSPLHLAVTVDGAAPPPTELGAALAAQREVSASDLYALLSGVPPGEHIIDIAVPAGFQLFTFTFG